MKFKSNSIQAMDKFRASIARLKPAVPVFMVTISSSGNLSEFQARFLIICKQFSFHDIVEVQA
jgi:hypothetical protein